MIDYFHPEYQEFIRLLNHHEVSYVLIGGIAVNIYGYHRATGDMDILYENSELNITRLKKVIISLGYDLENLKKQDFLAPTHIRLGEVPTTIDIINDTKGVDFTRVFKKAKTYRLDEFEIKVIDINDLIENKKALNTFKDLADAEALEIIQKKRKK